MTHAHLPLTTDSSWAHPLICIFTYCTLSASLSPTLPYSGTLTVTSHSLSLSQSSSLLHLLTLPLHPHIHASYPFPPLPCPHHLKHLTYSAPSPLHSTTHSPSLILTHTFTHSCLIHSGYPSHALTCPSLLPPLSPPLTPPLTYAPPPCHPNCMHHPLLLWQSASLSML